MSRLRRLLLPLTALVAVAVPVAIVWGTDVAGSRPVPKPTKGPVARDAATGRALTPPRARTRLTMPRVAVGQTVEGDDVRRPVKHDVARPLAGIGATATLPQVDPGVRALTGWTQPASFAGLDAHAAAAAAGAQLAPPDPTLAVGRAADGTVRILQWVNTAFVVMNGTGSIVSGPFAGNQVWNGFGGACEKTNRGDPLVRYDQWAGRWVMSQFAFETDPSYNLLPPFYQCLAVSRTQDPAGEWDRWAYAWAGDFNDYGKFGMTPGAYAFTLNMFPDGADPYSSVLMFDRAALLRGDPGARAVYADLRGLGTGQRFGVLPADPEGPVPASIDGLPMAMLDASSGSWVYENTLADRLALMRAVPDFAAGTLTVTVTQRLPITPAYLGCALSTTDAGGGACIPQPGNPQLLDSLGDRLMYRLAWRRVGGEERLVVTHTVSPAPASPATAARPTQARWIMLARPPDGDWVLDDSGATPTATSGDTAPFRWMPTAAIDSTGGMTMVFAIASRPAGGTHASLALTGHGPEDGAGTMQGGGLAPEQAIVAGTTNQTWTQRWGDYFTAISDPVTPCRVWATGEYMANDVGTFTENWGTWVTAVEDADCAGRAVPGALATTEDPRGRPRVPVVGRAIATRPATFTALDGSAISPDISYQWLLCRNQQCAPTAATGTSYVPTESDIGAVLRVKATATRANGTVQTSIGPPSAVVAAAPPAPAPAPGPAPVPPTETTTTVPAPSATPTPSVAARTGATITAGRMTRAARLARPRGSRVAYRVKGGPRGGLVVVRQDIRAKRAGTYRVTVTVITRTGTRTSRAVIVRVR